MAFFCLTGLSLWNLYLVHCLLSTFQFLNGLFFHNSLFSSTLSLSFASYCCITCCFFIIIPNHRVSFSKWGRVQACRHAHHIFGLVCIGFVCMHIFIFLPFIALYPVFIQAIKCCLIFGLQVFPSVWVSTVKIYSSGNSHNPCSVMAHG